MEWTCKACHRTYEHLDHLANHRRLKHRDFLFSHEKEIKRCIEEDDCDTDMLRSKFKDYMEKNIKPVFEVGNYLEKSWSDVVKSTVDEI